jgi:GNAT superfamily N-acetyltransferase
VFEVRIVHVSEVDLAQVASLVNAAFLTHPLMTGDRTSADGLRDEAGENGRLLVIEDGGGLLACALIRSASAEWDSAEGYAVPANALYYGLAGVRPERMRSGAGRALLEAAETEARRLGHSHIVLSTLREFQLVPYYERLGFSAAGHEDFEPGHWGIQAPHRLVHFEKAIAGGIREALPEDAASIAAVVNAAYRVEDFFKIGDRTDVDEVAGIIGRHRFLVSDHPDGGLAGAVYVSMAGGRGHFGMLSVAPAAQGTGLGRRLIVAAERISREAGCDTMDLEYVNLRQELPAFYKKLGYAPCGTAPWPQDQLHRISQPAHFILMSKPLRVATPEAAVGGAR